jgi:iron(III) transport system substrate-binding protein
VALGYPLFGTTATHFMVLRQVWGSEDWERWCRALQANKPLLLDGNSVVVQLVGRGEAALGLTDSDDIAAAQRQGLPIRSLPYEQSSMKIRNTMAITRGAPHPKEAQRLLEYLQSEAVLKQLIAAHALEETSIDPQEANDIDWPRLLAEMDNATTFLRQVFLR